MGVSLMHPQTSGPDRIRTVGHLGAVAAAVTAILYLLIGVGVLRVGESSTGAPNDLLSFGAIVGGTFAVVAALLWFVRSKVLWSAIAVLQVIVLVGYVAAAGLRTPSFEPWGILVKVCQLAVLAAVLYLIVRGRPADAVASRSA
jgi:hypothetical protein